MVIKGNTDVAFDCHIGVARLSMLIQDENAYVLVSTTSRVEHVLNTVFAKVMAILFCANQELISVA